MLSSTEIDAMLAIISNMPKLVKQLKIKNKIDLLKLKKDNGYPIDCDHIDDISSMLDND